MTARFSWQGIVARTLFSATMVFMVYNPSGHSYVHWVSGGFSPFWPKFTIGLLLLLAHGAIWGTIIGVLKWHGVLLVTLTLIGAWISIAQLFGTGGTASTTRFTILLCILTMLYSIGLSWSLIHHRLSGITHVETIK
jgi:hypothetical protein